MPLIMFGVLLVLGCFTEQISMMMLTVRVFSPWPNPWGST